ncbi:uncharacterized protein LOC144128233 isoform X4 [Amblyomma americanum]
MGKVARSPDEEAARRERQRGLARERARRRRANPEARARDTEAMRKRRAEHPELRAREAQAKRDRIATNPESKARQVEAQRRYAEANREKRNEAKRRRRNADPGLRVLEAFQCRQRGSTSGADGRFERQFLDRGFGHSCKAKCAAAGRTSSQPTDDSREHGQGFLTESKAGAVVGTCAACGSFITFPPVPGVGTQTEAKHEGTQTRALVCARGTQTST